MNEAGLNDWTALHWAAYLGLAGVVRLLLARQDVEVNKTARMGPRR